MIGLLRWQDAIVLYVPLAPPNRPLRSSRLPHPRCKFCPLLFFSSSSLLPTCGVSESHSSFCPLFWQIILFCSSSALPPLTLDRFASATSKPFSVSVTGPTLHRVHFFSAGIFLGGILLCFLTEWRQVRLLLPVLQVSLIWILVSVGLLWSCVKFGEVVRSDPAVVMRSPAFLIACFFFQKKFCPLFSVARSFNLIGNSFCFPSHASVLSQHILVRGKIT